MSMMEVKQGHFWVLTEKEKEKKTHCRQQALQLRVWRVCDLQIKESRVF